MKPSVFVAMLLVALAASPALASSVLVPKDGTVNPYAAAAPPAAPADSKSSAPADAKTNTAPTATVSIPSVLPNTPAPANGSANSVQIPAIYIPVAQQQELIDAEKRALTAAQQMQQQANAPGQSREQQEMNQKIMEQMAPQVLQSQSRLKALQGGTLNAADLATLYHP